MKKLILIALLTVGCYQGQGSDTDTVFDDGIREKGLDDSPSIEYTQGYGELYHKYDCNQLAVDMAEFKCDLCPMLLVHDCADWLLENTIDGAIYVAGAKVTDFDCVDWDLECEG